jgi:hypothetical protein
MISNMSKLLNKAIAKARKLPSDEQDAIGALILEELADEARWAETFARTQEQLGRWADEVIKEIKSGKAGLTPMDFDRQRK